MSAFYNYDVELENTSAFCNYDVEFKNMSVICNYDVEFKNMSVICNYDVEFKNMSVFLFFYFYIFIIMMSNSRTCQLFIIMMSTSRTCQLFSVFSAKGQVPVNLCFLVLLSVGSRSGQMSFRDQVSFLLWSFLRVYSLSSCLTSCRLSVYKALVLDALCTSVLSCTTLPRLPSSPSPPPFHPAVVTWCLNSRSLNSATYALMFEKLLSLCV